MLSPKRADDRPRDRCGIPLGWVAADEACGQNTSRVITTALPGAGLIALTVGEIRRLLTVMTHPQPVVIVGLVAGLVRDARSGPLPEWLLPASGLRAAGILHRMGVVLRLGALRIAVSGARLLELVVDELRAVTPSGYAVPDGERVAEVRRYRVGLAEAERAGLAAGREADPECRTQPGVVIERLKLVKTAVKAQTASSSAARTSRLAVLLGSGRTGSTVAQGCRHAVGLAQGLQVRRTAPIPRSGAGCRRRGGTH
jgi:hypothetical protein